jgi:AbiV family abortive infection protein
MRKRKKERSRNSELRLGKMLGRNPFSGHLKPQAIADGINMVRKNGMRLVTDANLMLEHKRYASALALAVLAIEEQGKELMLRKLAVLKPAESPAELWKDFRNHLEKNRTWILPYAAAEQPNPTLKSLHEAVFDEGSDHPFVLEWAKQTAIYVDCIGSGDWQDPESAVDEDHAAVMVRLADVMQGRRMQISAEEIAESIQLVRNGATIERVQDYVNKWGDNKGLPVV